MEPERAAGLAHAALLGQREQLQVEVEEDARIGHSAGPPAHGFEDHEHGASAPHSRSSELSRLLGTVHSRDRLPATGRRGR
jgi:hypothetical protein